MGKRSEDPMTTRRSLVFLAALCTALAAAHPAAAQQTVADRTITVQVKLDGQPQSGVSIFTLAAGNKYSPSTPPVAETNNTGSASVLLSGLLSANKPHTQMEVTLEVCVDGKKRIFIVPAGSEDQVPKDTNDCKHHRIGAFWWDGGSHVVIEIGQNPGVTQTSGGLFGFTSQTSPLVTGWAGGGIGFKNIGGTSGQITSFQSAFPGGTFVPEKNAFAGELNGAVGVSYAVFGLDLWRANPSDSNGSGPVLGGGTDTAHISQQNQGLDITAGGRIPLPDNFSLIIFGGGNFWHSNIDTRETVTGGTTITTSGSSIHISGTGWMGGMRGQFKCTRRISIVAGYSYLPLRKGPVDIHLNEGTFGVLFAIFGAPAR